MNIYFAYKLFNLDKNTAYTNTDIKKIYKNLILKYHPDKNKNKLKATKYSQTINEAYSLLLEEININTCETNIINILKEYTKTGQEDLDIKIKECGEMLYSIIN